VTFAKPLVLVLIAALVCVGAPAASGKDTLVGFQTPSHRIACLYAFVDGARSLRCDVDGVAHPAKKPKSCDLDYGSAFGLGPTGRAFRLCHGDTVRDPKAKVLPYGRTRTLGPFACTSRATGLRCTTGGGRHGFELSRATQRLF
jgi:hypothetical protein